MAFTFQNRRLGYDNIKAGSATGKERTILGASVTDIIAGDCTTKPDKDRNGSTSTSSLAIGKRENVFRQPTTNDANAQETNATSGTSHTGWTSDTSSTSVFYENLGSSNIPGNVS